MFTRFSCSILFFTLVLIFSDGFALAYTAYGAGDDSYSAAPSYGGSEKVEAAIMSKQTVRTIPVMSQKSGGGGNTIVDINGSGGGGGLVLRFNSAPGSITAIQKMSGGASEGKVQKQSVMAEPDVLVQDVKKPVIQKVRLQITPIRKVFQEVKPVQEQVETVIAKEEAGGMPMPKYGPSGASPHPY